MTYMVKTAHVRQKFGICRDAPWSPRDDSGSAAGADRRRRGRRRRGGAADRRRVEAAILQFNQMASEVPAARPWDAPHAGEWDVQTVAKWVQDNLHTAEARDLAGLAIRGVYGEEATQISLLDLLSAVTGVGGDFNTLIGDAQSIRFVGVPQQF